MFRKNTTAPGNIFSLDVPFLSRLALHSMMKNARRRLSGKRDILLHFMMGFIIIMHGLERLDHHFSTSLIFILSGFIFIACAVFHHRLSHRFPYMDSLFHCIEAILAIVVAIELFQDDKKYIPFFYLLAAGLYFFAGFKVYARRQKMNEPSADSSPAMPSAVDPIAEEYPDKGHGTEKQMI